MTEHAVVIVGGGPTGLMLAAELALASVDVAIVERRGSQDLIGSHAGGLHSRTIEEHGNMGVASDAIVSTHFEVPAVQEPGPGVLEVVASGIASQPVFVRIH
jgi:2-polyprenyl-6-methoxyphenol hydroxylase-like FAD-dependent oxidoreductase